MNIHALKIRNFRRLKNTVVDLDKEISIFVGSNNSGKTSTVEALRLFTDAQKNKFSINDFSSDCWGSIIDVGNQINGAILPKISIDFWFDVEEEDVHRVIDILPSLDWEDVPVGLRVEFTAINDAQLLDNFQCELTKAKNNLQTDDSGDTTYHPWPENLYAYLSDKLSSEYELQYYVLDHSSFDDCLNESDDYAPLQILPEKNRGGGKEILNSLLKVDFLGAQRHMSDDNQKARAENLSRRLSSFYTRNLEQSDDNFDAMRVLKASENMLNNHLEKVFKPVLERLAELGYPGVDNPSLLLKTALNPASMMKDSGGTEVHYSLLGADPDDNIQTLPDRYNGLGYKNLIYMVVELLDTHMRWLDIKENRPPIHLILIEEPEAHLHVQLQQVFIRRIIKLLRLDDEESNYYKNQIVVTTHSPHILYERGFQPIRYFRRESSVDGLQTSEVLNLSKFYDNEPNNRNFLERYLKLTHCDLFFADAAILVEGNVERLLIPQMIEKEAKELTKAYLSILEVGGAFAHKFRSLIDFLGITVLVITDIDSVLAEALEIEDAEGNKKTRKKGSTCMVHEDGAVTSNSMLKSWLPNKTTIIDLLAASEEDRTQEKTNESNALVHVVYQTEVPVTWNGEDKNLTGRTLEEAFAIQNLTWCQCIDQNKLRIPENNELTLDELANRLHKRIKGSSFKKTDFALELLTQDPNSWESPSYITQGLLWLQKQLNPKEEVKEAHEEEIE